MKRQDLYEYQNRAVKFIKENKKSALFLDMGLGKTVSTLTALSELQEDLAIKRTLIIAPLRVCNTVWKQEAEKWSHLKHLKINICTGTSSNRLTKINQRADIYIINHENVKWLLENCKWKWDSIVIDESTTFKNHASKKFIYLSKVIKYTNYRTLLTGTPSPNGLTDLWAQIYLLDEGERLGKNITSFRKTYCTKDPYVPHKYNVAPFADDVIKSKISDLCLTMKSKDYIEIKDAIEIDMVSEFSKKDWVKYKEFSKKLLLQVKNDEYINAKNRSVLDNKLQQMSNGAVYDEHGDFHVIHQEKINMLKEIQEMHPDESILVAYSYKSDVAIIKKHFPEAVEMSDGAEKLWNDGKIKMLIGHPASMGHGLNLQFGGRLTVWYGITPNLEHYDQLNKRLHRNGQKHVVKIIRLLMKESHDYVNLQRLQGKNITQESLINYLKNVCT